MEFLLASHDGIGIWQQKNYERMIVKNIKYNLRIT